MLTGRCINDIISKLSREGTADTHKELKKIKKVLTSFRVCDNILKLSHESETELKQIT